MKKVLYILLFAVLASSANAQETYVSWQYSMGFGSGDLHSYINPASFRGVTFNYSKFVKPGVALGFELGWNVFYEKKPFDTYTTGNFSYSGKQWRHSNNVPMLFTAGYFLNTDDKITPFAGLGIGTMYTERRTDFGTYAFTNDAWQFAMKPELGIIFQTDGASLLLSSKYYYGFKGGDLPAQSYFTLNVGLLFRK
jgi:opacity protein-like surface antigen